jgi:Zn-dependent peptidase ImmA (M78 family)
VRALLGAADAAGPGLVTEASLPALLFRASSPRLSIDDIVTLARLAAVEPGSPNAEFAALGQPSVPPANLDTITADGVELALRARAELAVPPSAALEQDLDLERVVLARLGVRVEEVHLDDPWIDGVAVAAPNQRPLIAVNRTGRFARTPWGRRMTLAHELCHLLHDVDDRGRVAIVSNPWADAARERRANAFAVTLLAPEAAIEAVLDRDPSGWSKARLRRAMEILGVGLTTLTRQLQNLGWISASEREAWVDELAEEGR